MILLVFVAAMLVSILLDRQARAHRLERAAEYERLGIPIPPRRPKLKRTEAWLNVGLGLLLVGLAPIFTLGGLQTLRLVESFPGHAADPGFDITQLILQGSFLLASGIALAWLGWKAIREITRFESGASLDQPGGSAISAGSAPSRRSFGFTLTAAIAAGAFFAGLLTGYMLLSRETPPPAPGNSGQATVSLDIQTGSDTGLPSGFAEDLGRRFEAELGSLPGVRVVRAPDAAFMFKARLGRHDGFIVISWNVVRTRDNAPYFNRRYSIPVNESSDPLRVMISSLSSSFGEKRSAAEFERILRLPENSLD
jgi:hypothetical protein